MAKWILEPGHTAAEFRVRHMMVTWVRGIIPGVEGTLDLDLDSPVGGVVEVTMDAQKLWSGDEARDGHLKAADFLDAENHPNLTFKGEFKEQIGETDYRVAGDLTIRGITRPVEMEVDYLGSWATPFWVGNEDKGPKTRAGFTGTTRINRHDFDVKWHGELEKGGVVVGNDVFITIDAEALHES
jgi:polyisoprenoid-binding protein YceI